MSQPLHSHARGARILLVDNYSSFTYNLYQYLAELTGLTPCVLRNDAELPAGVRLSDFDAAVLSPGPGQPSRVRDFGICAGLLERRELFILGVCLGHEGLGLHHGANVVRAREAFHGRASRIRHSGDELFAGMPEEFSAVRYHSLAVEEPLPTALRAIARTVDGELMAMRHTSWPHWGVQFHPESAETACGKDLLANFCALSLEGRTRVPRSASTAAAESPPLQASPTGPAVRSWTVLRQPLDAEHSCPQLFRRLYAASESAFWLDGGADQSLSYLGDASGPHAYQLDYSLADSRIRFSGARQGSEVCTSVFDYLQEELASQGLGQQFHAGESAQFQGGFVGYLGYELKAECGGSNRHVSRMPDAHWIFCDRFVVFDHATGSVELVSLIPAGHSEAAAQRWFQDCKSRLAAAPVLADRTSAPKGVAAPTWRDSRADYLEMVRRCQEEILAGESYELCLTTRAEVNVHVDGLALYEDMRASNPAPYAAFLQCGGFALASASPERFLKIDRQGRVESKPIKGTAGRGDEAGADAELSRALCASAKERAENLMIVDLVRNDLGRSCEIGSVVVDRFAALESYATVHQLVSSISGRLRRDVSALACARAAFPGGSMTGAPKLRSMEILDALESDARGPYSGSIGYLSLCGSLDLSIVIRTVLVEEERVSVGVGGAVTALSRPEDEYDEVLLKAMAPLAAIKRTVD